MQISCFGQMGLPSVFARLLCWQFLLQVWFIGESGFSGFLARSAPKAWNAEVAEKITREEVLREDDPVVATAADLTHGSFKNASVASNQTQAASQMKESSLMRQEPAAVSEDEHVIMYDVPLPRVVEDEDYVYKKRTVRPKHKSKEGKLINFMRKYAVDKHEIDCVILCRYGETERHTWTHCLQKCISKADKRKSFMKMLPEEDHTAKALDYEVPPEFEEDLKRIKQEVAKQERHGEL
jgi:hypothetical protein